MAYRINKINPLDLQARKAIGINIPFSVDEVFSQNYQTKDAIKNNIINFMLTGKGERFMNPTFGSNIRNLLFENVNEESLDAIAVSLREELQVYFPQILINELQINPLLDSNSINVQFKYQIRFTNIADSISINFV
jgi:phage baseplate assembly protein W